MDSSRKVSRSKAACGILFLIFSLLILRLYQMSNVDLAWTLIMGMNVLLFSLGAKWTLENIRSLNSYSRLWPLFLASMAFAWLVHAGQVDEVAANTWLGEAYGAATLQITVFFLRLSGIHVNLQGSVLIFPPPSKVASIGFNALCGGFLSFLMFTTAFGIVLFDVARQIARRKLLGIFILGALATLLISSLRVYLVLVFGYYGGFDVMMVAHNYLGYVLFLSFITAFWYLVLGMSRRAAQIHPVRTNIGVETHLEQSAQVT